MNIISGIAKGIRLEVPKGLSVRPTSVMARKSIFDSLKFFEGKSVVDLFAGTGSLGLEAASRGAEHVIFFETSPAHCEILQKNIEKVSKAGVSSRLEVIKSNALKPYEKLSTFSGKVDLIFADPPYNESSEVFKRLISDEKLYDWAQNSLMVFEAPSEASRKPELVSMGFWSLVDKKNYGQSCFLLLKPIKKI